MTSRSSWAAAAVLALVSPVLLLPALLGPAHQWMAAPVAIATLIGAVGLVKGFGRLAWYEGVLVVTAVVGWVLAADQPETINHFCGLALGLFAMGTVAVWCRTRERLAMGTVAVLLCGAAALAVGSRSTSPVHTSKALFGDTTSKSGPARPLPMSGLHAHTSVNRNALAATAMMVLPVAAAVALSPARWFGAPMVLQLIGLLSAVGAIAVVVLMQSRSAWISAAFILWIWARGWMRPRWWWLIALTVLFAASAALVFMWSGHPRGAEVAAAVDARLVIWEQALRALRPSPWFGIGLDYFRHSGYSPVFVFPDKIVGNPHAHNIFLQTALDVGLIGLVSYVAIVVFVMRRAWNIVAARAGDDWVRHVGFGAAMSIVSVHMYGLLDAVALGTKVGIFQWLSCGLVLAAWKLQAQSRLEPAKT